MKGSVSDYQPFVRFLKLMSPLNYTIEGRITFHSGLESDGDIEMKKTTSKSFEEEKATKSGETEQNQKTATSRGSCSEYIIILNVFLISFLTLFN